MPEKTESKPAIDMDNLQTIVPPVVEAEPDLDAPQLPPVPVPSLEVVMPSKDMVENKKVKTAKGAEVKKPQSPEKRECPIRNLFAKLEAKMAQVRAEIADKNPKDYSSLVSDSFSMGVDEPENGLPRILMKCNTYTYVIIDQRPVAGESKVTLEARIYAHIPAEIIHMVGPWLKEFQVWISPEAMIRPSSL